jgi:hypothetical protein
MRAPVRAEDAPEGLLYREEFISADEEHRLLSLLSSIEFRAVVMRGQAARRTVRHFGLDYDYETTLFRGHRSHRARSPTVTRVRGTGRRGSPR